MKLIETALAGVFLAETTTASDHRGALSRLFCERELAPVLGDRHIVQINQTLTRSVGTVRGMHWQYSPNAEMKFVRCLKGRVWDVAVDLRTGSSTFLNWHAEELSAANARMMVLPEGFAHGFQVLESDSELLYLHTAAYARESEGGLSCSDERLGIRWPLPVRDLSVRDAQHPTLGSDFCGVKA